MNPVSQQVSQLDGQIKACRQTGSTLKLKTRQIKPEWYSMIHLDFITCVESIHVTVACYFSVELWHTSSPLNPVSPDSLRLPNTSRLIRNWNPTLFVYTIKLLLSILLQLVSLMVPDLWCIIHYLTLCLHWRVWWGNKTTHRYWFMSCSRQVCACTSISAWVIILLKYQTN